ncbi:PAS domain S-box [Nostoc sp. PCC 7524]|uniref:PAS domain-containing sensor histidine kinase n=1 Tax=Nostoc sp. (strain ATCC 29411 / PCC 7524) TaxID=28072 RepID=UPI00029EC576|nr:ATP-binding protein [Nostoc sp. PCC 7524]AFY46874.1 PAS domain S-box [Nostoc sp. PCC 7524]
MLDDSLSLPLTMFTALSDRSDLLMALTDRGGRIEWVNQAFVEHTRLAIDLLIGKKFFTVLAANSQLNFQQTYIREQLMKGESFKFELSYLSPEQREYWLLVDGQPIQDAEGITNKYAIMSSDITVRKLTETDLEQTRQRLKRLVEGVKLVPWEALDVNRQFTYVGPQAIELFGYELAQWYEPDFWYSHIHPEDLPQVVSHHQGITSEQDDYIVEYRFLAADSQWIWVKDIVNVVRSPDNVIQLFGFLLDIGERKQVEISLQVALKNLEHTNQELEFRVQQRTLALHQEKEKLEQTLEKLQKTQIQLIQSEKMSSLGQLVAGIAHEINNPVNFIYGNITYANEYIQDLLYLVQCYQQYYPHPEPKLQAEIEAVEIDFIIEDLPRLLSSMSIGANRIREIVLSLRNFSRLDEAEVKAVDIHEGIDSTLMILHNRLKAKPDFPEIQVMREYGKLPLVECYAGQLNQVFMNLIANAIDALEESTVKNSQVSTQPQIHICTEIAHEQQVVIRIADNGTGMSEEIRKRLFDPFFTTKPIGKGTGLGLSISYQIVVEKHQGKLECSSVIGKGTEFVISIPVKPISTPLRSETGNKEQATV